MGTFGDRMERDLQIRGYAPNTQKAYVATVRRFVKYFMRPPDQLTLSDVHRYQLHLTKERRVSFSTFNQAVCALRFFFVVTMETDWEIEQIPYQKTGRKLPEVFSQAEIELLLKCVVNLKHRAILMALYAGGLRVSEVVRLRVTDIDSDRMVIRVEQGKGRKDRFVMLSERLLGALREYWIAYKPTYWLFPGQDPSRPLNRGSVQEFFTKAKKAAGIRKPVTIHSLRHSFATHLLENGTNIRVIQRLLGHRSVRSTEIYTHVAANYVRETPSPFDRLGGRNAVVSSARS